MKKILAFALVLCMVLTFAACANKESAPSESTMPESTQPEITMQDIYDAVQTEAMLKNHQSIYIRGGMDDELWLETYLTKDYRYSYMPGEEFDWMEFMSDDVCYYYVEDDCVRYVFITPDGMGDFASDRAERSESIILGTEALENTIESVSEKDGRITVTGQENPANLAEFGMTSAKFEYVVDAKTCEMISLINDYVYEDGTTFCSTTEITYDADAPELLKTILAYESQTENLRNVTIVSNPGTEKEESRSVQTPKGLIIGFQYDDAFEGAVEFYIDAACTEGYDHYANTYSYLTIYIKWNE